jgi:hypothetical protein
MKIYMKKILLALSYVPLIYIIYVYARHGVVEAFIERTEFLEIIGILGFGPVITYFLLGVTGALDTFVAILFIRKDMFFPKMPYAFLYLWAALWPIVPRVIEWYGGMDPEPMEAVYVAVIAAAAYAMHIYHKKVLNLNQGF